MISKIGYVVNNRCDSDDKIALELALMFPLAQSKEAAWKYFISTCGKNRVYWNKHGYIAEKIEYSLKFKK